MQLVENAVVKIEGTGNGEGRMGENQDVFVRYFTAGKTLLVKG